MALNTLQMTDRLTQWSMNLQQAEAMVPAMVDVKQELVTRDKMDAALDRVLTPAISATAAGCLHRSPAHRSRP